MNNRRHFLMKITTLLSVLIFGAMVFSSGCKKDDVDYDAIDDKIIRDYLDTNNLVATKHESGIYYIITSEGYGAQPNVYSTVEVKYKGYLTDGTVFEDKENSAVTFTIAYTIKGWQYGIPLLKEGGEGIFFIPSNLGYGGDEPEGIPAHSVLIFEVKLMDVL